MDIKKLTLEQAEARLRYLRTLDDVDMEEYTALSNHVVNLMRSPQDYATLKTVRIDGYYNMTEKECLDLLDKLAHTNQLADYLTVGTWAMSCGWVTARQQTPYNPPNNWKEVENGEYAKRVEKSTPKVETKKVFRRKYIGRRI